MFKFRSFATLLAVAAALHQTSALAVPLAPGTAITPPFTEPDPVGGTVLANLAFSFTGPTFSGTLYSSVIAGDLNNLWHGLTFTYRYQNLSGDPVSRFTVSSFTGFLTDVSVQGANLAPVVMPSLIERTLNGSILRFNFSYPGQDIAPGASSPLMVVQTDAPAFISTLGGLIDGSTVNASTFAPVPEPATSALLLGGLLGFLCLRRR